MTPAGIPSVETRAQFARRCGVVRSTVTRWADAGRLVLERATGNVVIDDSIKRLEQTQDIRWDVAERWRQYRDGLIDFEGNPIVGRAPCPSAAPATPAPAAAVPHTRSIGDDDATAELDVDSIARRQRLSRLRETEAKAQLRELELAERSGALIARADVLRDLRTASTLIRGLLDQLPDRVAPLLAESERARALLVDELHRTGNQIADALTRAAEQHPDTGAAASPTDRTEAA
jgi:phage terminase Nu1 subunit (DNA packaging protein)